MEYDYEPAEPCEDWAGPDIETKWWYDEAHRQQRLRKKAEAYSDRTQDSLDNFMGLAAELEIDKMTLESERDIHKDAVEGCQKELRRFSCALREERENFAALEVENAELQEENESLRRDLTDVYSRERKQHNELRDSRNLITTLVNLPAIHIRNYEARNRWIHFREQLHRFLDKYTT